MAFKRKLTFKYSISYQPTNVKLSHFCDLKFLCPLQSNDLLTFDFLHCKYFLFSWFKFFVFVWECRGMYYREASLNICFCSRLLYNVGGGEAILSHAALTIMHSLPSSHIPRVSENLHFHLHIFTEYLKICDFSGMPNTLFYDFHFTFMEVILIVIVVGTN